MIIFKIKALCDYRVLTLYNTVKMRDKLVKKVKKVYICNANNDFS